MLQVAAGHRGYLRKRPADGLVGAWTDVLRLVFPACDARVTLPVTRPLLPAPRVLLLVAVSVASWAYFSPNRTERAAPAETDPEPVKILVLPFETSSRDAGQQAFADRLTNALIGRLQALPGQRVMGRGTSVALRDSARTVRELPADLGVQYVLEGSVDRAGGRIHYGARPRQAPMLSHSIR